LIVNVASSDQSLYPSFLTVALMLYVPASIAFPSASKSSLVYVTVAPEGTPDTTRAFSVPS